MNTKTMEQFTTLDTETLMIVEGGKPNIFKPIIKYIAEEVFSTFADVSTSSCRKNPKQWFCVKVG